jgi:hypothetical protein
MQSTRAKALISAAAATTALVLPTALAAPAHASVDPHNGCVPTVSLSQPISYEAKLKITKNTCGDQDRIIAYCHMAIVTTFDAPVLEQWWWQDGNAVSGNGTSSVSCGSIWTNIVYLHWQRKTSTGWVTVKSF